MPASVVAVSEQCFHNASLRQLAARGKKTLLFETNANDRFGSYFDKPPVGEKVTQLATNLYAVNTNPASALAEYGLMILKFKSVYEMVFENRVTRAFLRAIPGLDDYALYPYLEATVLRRNIAKASRADIEHFLKRWPDSLPESDVRDAYLRELARRGEWSTFRAFWKGSRDRDLQCDALAARVASGEKLDYAKDIEPLWTNPRALPGSCDDVLANARTNGTLIDALVWTRLLEAAESGNEDSAAHAAAMFSGPDKDAADRIADYETGVAAAAPVADYVTINISSPNTPGLRDLQHGPALAELLGRAAAARGTTPLFLKVAPDQEPAQIDEIAKAAIDAGVDALIVGNTTISRPPLQSTNASETGGLSGAPLAPLAAQRLRDFRTATAGRIPLVAVGGIASGAEAYARIRAGASLVQLYTGLVYGGPGLPKRILHDLEALMRRDGFAQVADAIGTG